VQAIVEKNIKRTAIFFIWLNSLWLLNGNTISIRQNQFFAKQRNTTMDFMEVGTGSN
jgi:hypothetical protein